MKHLVGSFYLKLSKTVYLKKKPSTRRFTVLVVSKGVLLQEASTTSKFIVPAVFKDKFLQNTTSIMFFIPVILLDGILQREQEPGSLFTQLSTSENIHQ